MLKYVELPFAECRWAEHIRYKPEEVPMLDKTYYDKAFAVAAEYCAELCKTYGIDVGNIVGHCEAYRLGYGSNHADPEHWMRKFNHSMDDFRKKVSEILKNNNIKTENKDETVSKNTAIEKGDLVSLAANATFSHFDTSKNLARWRRILYKYYFFASQH